MQLFDRLLVVAEIFLATNEDDRKALAEVKNLRDPLQVQHVSIEIILMDP